MNYSGVRSLTPLAVGATPSPDVVVFESRGAVLVLGDNAEIGDIIDTFAHDQRVAVFAPGIDARKFGQRVSPVAVRVTSLRGHLGAFQAEVRAPSGALDLRAACPNPDGLFDVVLDLCRQPLFTADVTPIGYFAPGEDGAARAIAVEAIRSLTGRFTKPRYFTLQHGLCAHSASSVPGCTRCLDVCSAHAISSAGATIAVDANLCQGCATCTLACPTGALSFKTPSRENLWHELLRVLGTRDRAQPTLVVHSAPLSTDIQNELVKRRALSLHVQPIAAFGEELWFSALAHGAGAVLLLNDGLEPEKTLLQIGASVAQARAILTAVGVSQDKLAWLTVTELMSRFAASEQPESPAQDIELDQASAIAPNLRNKRSTSLAALKRLESASGSGRTVDLPAGSTFGEVRIDLQRCTTCFACTHLCPTGALRVGVDTPSRLEFLESVCVQCGLCVQGCPEKAVSLHPRFAPTVLLDAVITLASDDEPFCCTSCGTPFISRRLLNSSLERLKDHPVLAAGGREALLMCPSCRQREMLSHE